MMRKFLALVMSLALCLTCFAGQSVFAEESAAKNYVVNDDGTVTYAINAYSVTGSGNTTDVVDTSDGTVIIYSHKIDVSYINFDLTGLGKQGFYKVSVKQRTQGAASGDMGFKLYVDDVLWGTDTGSVSGSTSYADAGVVRLSESTSVLKLMLSKTPATTFLYELVLTPVGYEEIALSVNKDTIADGSYAHSSNNGGQVIHYSGSDKTLLYNLDGITGVYDVYTSARFGSSKTGALSYKLYVNNALYSTYETEITQTSGETVKIGTVALNTAESLLKLEAVTAQEAIYVSKIILKPVTGEVKLSVNKNSAGGTHTNSGDTFIYNYANGGNRKFTYDVKGLTGVYDVSLNMKYNSSGKTGTPEYSVYGGAVQHSKKTVSLTSDAAVRNVGRVVLSENKYTITVDLTEEASGTATRNEAIKVSEIILTPVTDTGAEGLSFMLNNTAEGNYASSSSNSDYLILYRASGGYYINFEVGGLKGIYDVYLNTKCEAAVSYNIYNDTIMQSLGSSTGATVTSYTDIKAGTVLLDGSSAVLKIEAALPTTATPIYVKSITFKAADAITLPINKNTVSGVDSGSDDNKILLRPAATNQKLAYDLSGLDGDYEVTMKMSPHSDNTSDVLYYTYSTGRGNEKETYSSKGGNETIGLFSADGNADASFIFTLTDDNEKYNTVVNISELTLTKLTSAQRKVRSEDGTEIADNTAVAVGDTISVSAYYPEVTDGKIYVARYQEEVMESVECEEIDKYGLIKVQMGSSEDTIKVFVWDGTLTPLADLVGVTKAN